MTVNDCYLGLDVGTSGVRAVVIDSEANEVAASQSLMADHGSNHRDPAVWWSAVERVFEQLSGTFDLQRLVAVCVDATSGTLLAIDKEGCPVAEALMYNDAVNEPQILASIASHAPASSAVHGASSGLARAISLQGKSTGACRVLHQADWIAGKLTADFSRSDESNALKTGYDPVERCWPAWISDTGMDRAWLPQVAAAGTIMGKVSTAAMTRFGFAANTTLVAGMTDGCASFLATGADRVGDCVTALGSTITMKMLCDKPLFQPAYGIYSHRIGERWLAGGASNSGGSVLAHFFSADQLAELSVQIDPLQSSELQYYPLLQPGERFPHNDANWQPVLEPRPVDDVRFLQGLLEGMANIEATGYQRLVELGAPAPNSIRTVGGGSKNATWTCLRENRLALQSLPSISTDAAFGVAKFALQSVAAAKQKTRKDS